MYYNALLQYIILVSRVGDGHGVVAPFSRRHARASCSRGPALHDLHEVQAQARHRPVELHHSGRPQTCSVVRSMSSRLHTHTCPIANASKALIASLFCIRYIFMLCCSWHFWNQTQQLSNLALLLMF